MLDFDWRFSSATVNSLRGIFSGKDRVLYVGTPSLFFDSCCCGRSDWLVDTNPTYASLLPSTRRRVTANIPPDRVSGSFNAVVMDPPWYLEYYFTWIRSCLPLLRPRGSVYFIVFPPSVRPGAENERAQLFDTLSTIGTVEKSLQNVGYETPQFEIETELAVFGKRSFNNRYGELWKLTPKNWSNTASSGDFFTMSNSHHWLRFHRDRTVVMMRKAFSRSDKLIVRSPYYASLREPFILRSVSRRHGPRRVVDIWTSRNRVARLSAPDCTPQLLRLWAAGQRMDLIVEMGDRLGIDGKSLQTLFASLELET